MKNKTQYLSFVCLLLALASCNNETKEIAQDTKFCLTDTLKKHLETATAEIKTVENELVLTGKISFNEDKVARVFPLAGGFVKELKAELGDYVQKGQVLAWIRSPEIAGFRNEGIKATNDLRVAEKNAKIAEELYKTGTISQVELANAQRELQNAKGEGNRIADVIDMYGAKEGSLYPIKAPISGFVVEKHIALNMELRTEDISPVFTVGNLDNVWVLANIYESDMNKVKEGIAAEITTISYPDKIFNGKIDKIFSLMDAESKVVKAKIILQNPNFMLKPEMFANVTLRFNENAQKIAVPSKAVIFDKNKHFIMVYKSDCNIETREVQLYKAMPNTTYIEKGIIAGDKIMTRYHLLVYDALND